MKSIIYFFLIACFTISTVVAQETTKFEKNNQQKKDSTIFNCKICNDSKSPLIILVVDTKKYIITESDLRQIKSDWIKEINIVKDQNATSKYGDSGEYGVVEMFLKDEMLGEFSLENLEVINTTY
ncbi:hypothetical protein [Leeuwenhoekiella sp. LLG6367-2.1]|uniref:hypothetical protein n=1 Tax=Leeuwenhoekiella sp. LLG6367-2.1 TaxID=3160833 RepID=UPI00386614D0